MTVMSRRASAKDIVSRSAVVTSHMAAAAEELLRRGCHGVAAEVSLPGLADPLRVAVGVADPQRNVPLLGDELFAAASQAKMFTAASVLLLVRQGEISLEDPVARYLPDLPAVDPQATITQFLNHTSGIGNFLHAMPVLAHPWPSFTYDELMTLARLQGRRFPAGERLDYNNTDVIALARLCERVSGEPRDTFLKRHLFDPLGMKDTHAGSSGNWPRDRMARGYYVPTLGYDGPPLDVSRMPDYSLAGAAGDIVSTLPDLMRWARALLTPDNPVGLTLDDFRQDVADLGANIEHWFFPHRYGRGVESWRWGGREVWGHRGSFFGYHSGTFVEPVSGVAVSMFLTMCTRGSFLHFIDRLAHGYMTFLADCVTMAADSVDLP